MKSPDTEPTQSQKEELNALAALPDDQIDTSDIPKVIEGANSVRGLFHKSASERSKAIGELRGRRPSVTDTSERGLEDRICEMLAGRADESGVGDVGNVRLPIARVGVMGSARITTASIAWIWRS